MHKMTAKTKKNIFVVLMLLYPVLQFALFFGYVNIDTIILTFQGFDWNKGYTFVGFDNYIDVFNNIFNDSITQDIIITSLLYLPISCFVILPLSLLFSYFLYKKMPLAGIFRVIYFLPSILPVVVMTLSFSFLFDSSFGPINVLYKALFGLDAKVPVWFADYPTNQLMIFAYCIWVGLGFNIILLSGAIARIPGELMEYGKLEGISFVKEFRLVVVPMIWPTIATTFILGVTSVFTVMMQPLMLTPNSQKTSTIALSIYQAVTQNQKISYNATFGLILSLIGLPIILLIRKGLNSVFKEVEY